MKNKEIILKKDKHSISIEISRLKKELEQMQDFLDYYNSLHYVSPLTDIEEVKKYLRSTKQFHEDAVIVYLKTKMSELPPNLAPLKEMYNISQCDDVDFSNKNLRFELLELNEGKLNYNLSIYSELEAKHTIIATHETAAALRELDRTWTNIELLCNTFAGSETYKRIYLDRFKQALDFIEKPYSSNRADDGNQTRWDLQKLNTLAASGFGK